MVDGSIRGERLRPLGLWSTAARKRVSRELGEPAGRLAAIWDSWALAAVDRLDHLQRHLDPLEGVIGQAQPVEELPDLIRHVPEQDLGPPTVDERARVSGGAAGAGLRLASCQARFSGSRLRGMRSTG
jgi:hypothetical protein